MSLRPNNNRDFNKKKIKTFLAESPLSGSAEWGTRRVRRPPWRRVPNLRKGDSAEKVFWLVTRNDICFI